MMEHNGKIQPGPMPPPNAVLVHARRQSDGTWLLRYWVAQKYLGEVSLYAVDDEALRVIAKDIYGRIPQVVVPV